MKHSERNLEAYREKMFQRAVGTKTDRPKAEKWARKLIGDEMGDYKFHWCKSPGAVAGLVGSLGSPARLGARLPDSLLVSLRARLLVSLLARPLVSLRARLLDSLQDSGWLAFYSYPEKAGLAEFTKEDSRRLKAWRKLLKHCFAIYAFEGHIILVDRPVEVKVENGNLIDIKFG